MRSVMKHMFSEVPNVAIPRSTFDRSHGYKTAFDAGWLVPIICDEVLPGDSYQVNLAAFARMATPIFPLMDNIRMETFFFFVPTRLVWDNWQKFCGEQKNPNDSTDYIVPQVVVTDAQIGDIFDYMGLPTGLTTGYGVSALPFRCYQLIWAEWFRDQNLQDYPTLSTGDGPDLMSNHVLRKRNKRHDYFTSALPFLQKGDPVQLALGTQAPVRLSTTPNAWTVFTAGSNTPPATPNQGLNFTTGGTLCNDPQTIQFALQPNSSLYTDLTSATASTVNELRQAIQIQRMLERDARAGTRYVEILQSYFGVTSPDARLQRPEYLGGGSTPVNISPVAQTYGNSADNTFTGTLGAIGTAGIRGHGFAKSFTEHGFIIGLVNVRADLTYQQGIEKFWKRQTRYDFYWPTLAHLGEQEIKNYEIYLDDTTNANGVVDETFGFQERYAEYRYKPSKITNAFRSTAPNSLDAWHLSQEFTGQPTLDSNFITEDPPLDRVIAVPSEPHFIFDSYIQMRCTRPMPIYSVPGMIDHF